MIATMTRSAGFAVLLCISGIAPVAGNAWEPVASELQAAVKGGDFTEYFNNVSAWLKQKVDVAPDKITEGTMRDLLKDRKVVLAIDQRRLIDRAGAKKLGAFAAASDARRKFLAGFLSDPDAMNLYLEGGEPAEKDHAGALGVLCSILTTDPAAGSGMLRRLATAIALAHAQPAKCFGYGEVIDPVKRYEHFKAAQKNKELTPMFDDLTVWEYAKVVDTAASDKDMTWAREMMRTMRPELVREARYVRMVSEVQYGKANWGPAPHDLSTILYGGGACGPRAWFGRMINASFGVPVWGVKQPGHAAVGFLGSEGWKVMYGRGWDKSTWDHMNGNQFLEIVRARDYAEDFSVAEHLKWLADAVGDKKVAGALKSVADQVTKTPKGPRTVHKLTPQKCPQPQDEKPWAPVPGVEHIMAADFVKSKGAARVQSFDSGKQVYFQKNAEEWVEYKVHIPKAETYGITIGHAVANGNCRVRIYVGDTKIGWMHLNNTKGLWGKTKEYDFAMPQTDTLRFVFPKQRGVAVKWIELRAKGGAAPGVIEQEPAAEPDAKGKDVDPRAPEDQE